MGSTLRIRIVAEHGAVVAQKVKADLPLIFLLREAVPIGGLPAGQYRVIVEMLDNNGEVLKNVPGKVCKAECRFTIAPPAPHEVVFDRHGIYTSSLSVYRDVMVRGRIDEDVEPAG